MSESTDTFTTASPSPVADRLGLLALVPFVGGAIVVWTAGPTVHFLAVQALSLYAAVVVSFVGGIHWGLAFARPAPATRSFVWGVVPAIVVWVVLLTVPRVALSVDAAMLVGCYLVDRHYPADGIGAWLPLRLRLTVVAVASTVAGAIGV